MSKQQYALVPVELLKQLPNKEGIDEPITDPKEIAECERILKRMKKGIGVTKCKSIREFLEQMDKL